MVKNNKIGPDGNNGFWEIPKGHIENNDTDQLEGALRELYEESGLKIDKKDIDINDI